MEATSFSGRFKVDFRRNKELYIIFIPVAIYYLVFQYGPLFGLLVAFKDYTPGATGVFDAPWASDFGFGHFIRFFNSIYFWRLIRNTLTISVTSLAFGFPAPILLALLMNEIRGRNFARVVQTVTYMPHFISMVVICGMIIQFLDARTGFLIPILNFFGHDGSSLLQHMDAFVPIYVVSGIWQEVGWGSIIYLAALAGIDQEQYEAAKIDGAGRWKQTLYVTIPGIAPQIIILFIMRLGNILNVGFEKVMLLYNPGIYEKADVISTYIYRASFEYAQWSFGSAVGMFNSIIGFVLVISANWISGKVSETSLW